MKVAYTDFIQPDLNLEARLLGEAGMTLVPAEPQCRTPDEVIRVADGVIIAPMRRLSSEQRRRLADGLIESDTVRRPKR